VKKGDPPTLDQRPLYRNVMAVLATLAAVSALVAGVANIPGLKSLVFGEESYAPNVEILFDRSEGMGHRLGQEPETKLEAAVASFKGLSLGSDNLALRLFGGACEQREPAKPNLGFSSGQRDKLSAELDRLTPMGKGSLVEALLAAIGDFDPVDKSKGSRRIVVISGSADDCKGAALDEIQSEVRKRSQISSVQLDFHFFGLALTADETAKLEEVRKATNGNPLVLVNNRKELDAELTKVLIVKPVAEATNAIVTILNAGVERLNNVRPESGTAEADLQAARDEFKRSDPAFGDLGKRQTRSDFKTLYGLAAELRDIQQRMLTDAEKLIARDRAKDIEGFNATVKEYNDHRDAYNKKVAELNSALQQLVTASR
jgi:hypothetical protein